MRNIEKLKQARSQYQWDDYVTSRSIREQFPECRRVILTGKMTYLSGLGKFEQEIHRVFNPEDRLYCHYECNNKDCTGNGFSLTSYLAESIRSGKVVEGELHCDGKEDWKYLNASGCSCMTTFMFKLTPEIE